jgi:hypothetical protein
MRRRLLPFWACLIAVITLAIFTVAIASHRSFYRKSYGVLGREIRLSLERSMLQFQWMGKFVSPAPNLMPSIPPTKGGPSQLTANSVEIQYTDHEFAGATIASGTLIRPIRGTSNTVTVTSTGVVSGEAAHLFMVKVPVAWLGVMCALIAAYLTWRWRRTCREWRATGHCATCGYDLRASFDRCPECGTVIASVAS